MQEERCAAQAIQDGHCVYSTKLHFSLVFYFVDDIKGVAVSNDVIVPSSLSRHIHGKTHLYTDLIIEAVSQFRGFILQRLDMKTNCVTTARLDCLSPSTPEKQRLRQMDPSWPNISHDSLGFCDKLFFKHVIVAARESNLNVTTQLNS